MLAEYRSFLGPVEGLTKERLSALFQPSESGLTDTGLRVFSISTLLGMDHVNSDLSLADDPLESTNQLPFDEALAFLKRRVPIKKKEWTALEPKLRFRAFTVAKLAEYQAIDKVRQGLLSALESGKGLASFWENLEAKEAGSPFYWETVWRTNLQTAYNAGRRIEMEKTNPEAYQLVVIDDERTTATCRPLVGLTLPANHPFWKTHWPPFHFGCRTTVRSIFKESGELRGLKFPTLDEVEKSFKPKPGFGLNPIDSGNYWMLLPTMFEQGLKTGAITELNFIDNVIADYDQVWKGYKRDFEAVGDPSGGHRHGWVDVHATSREFDEFPENFAVAKSLAVKGHQVKVLPQHYHIGWKNPDFLIDGKLWELETPVAMTQEAVSRAVRQGQKQAENLILHITGDMDLRMVHHTIWLRLTRKDSPSRLKEIVIIHDGEVERSSVEYAKAHWK